MTRYIAPVLFLGLVLFSCKKKNSDLPPAVETTGSADTRIVATVNGDPITLAEFQNRFSREGFKPEQDAALKVKEDFLNRLIERKMLLSEAQRKHITIGPAEIDKRVALLHTEHGKDVKDVLSGLGLDYEKWRSDIWEDLMIEQLLAHEVNRRITVSSSEVRRYYNANPQEFEKPEQVHVRQIVVATDEEARTVLDLLLRQKNDFATLAREKSTAPEAENGGDLGYFALGDMPAEFNVVFGLPKGGISGAVKSPYGYHVFKLEDKRGAGRISLDEASKDITEKLHREKEDMRYKQWLIELRSRMKFEVNYRALEH